MRTHSLPARLADLLAPGLSLRLGDGLRDGVALDLPARLADLLAPGLGVGDGDGPGGGGDGEEEASGELHVVGGVGCFLGFGCKGSR